MLHEDILVGVFILVQENTDLLPLLVTITHHLTLRPLSPSRHISRSKNSKLNFVSLQEAGGIHCNHFRIYGFYSPLCFCGFAAQSCFQQNHHATQASKDEKQIVSLHIMVNSQVNPDLLTLAVSLR